MITIRGFSPHVTQMDRKRYCNQLKQEMFLQSNRLLGKIHCL